MFILPNQFTLFFTMRMTAILVLIFPVLCRPRNKEQILSTTSFTLATDLAKNEYTTPSDQISITPGSSVNITDLRVVKTSTVNPFIKLLQRKHVSKATITPTIDLSFSNRLKAILYQLDSVCLVLRFRQRDGITISYRSDLQLVALEGSCRFTSRQQFILHAIHFRDKN